MNLIDNYEVVNIIDPNETGQSNQSTPTKFIIFIFCLILNYHRKVVYKIIFLNMTLSCTKKSYQFNKSKCTSHDKEEF